MTAPHPPTPASPPVPAEDGSVPPVPQSDAEAIGAALVQATESRMTYMRQQMKAAGHIPPGV